MKEQLQTWLADHCSSCMAHWRAFSDNYLTVTLLHAWVLGFIALSYVAWAAPLALESLVLVAAKVWVGALIGLGVDRAVFRFAAPTEENPNAAWMARRAAVIAACVLGVALGV